MSTCTLSWNAGVNSVCTRMQQQLSLFGDLTEGTDIIYHENTMLRNLSSICRLIHTVMKVMVMFFEKTIVKTGWEVIFDLSYFLNLEYELIPSRLTLQQGCKPKLADHKVHRQFK